MNLNILPKPPDLFIGRAKELKKLEKFFSETNFFYIEGISGIGKTALMLKWADLLSRKSEYKDKIIWIECRNDWTLDNLLIEIDDNLVRCGERTINDPFKERRREEKFLYIINNLNKKNYALFIDNFHNIKGECSRIFIDTFKNYIKVSHVYVISNESLLLPLIDILDIVKMRIKDLEHDDAILFIKKILKFHDIENIPDDETLMKIVDKSKGHPLILKTFFGFVISRICSLEDIIEEKIIEKDTGNIIFGEILNKLPSFEREILEILSICRISLSPDSIMEICNIQFQNEILSLLENKLLIEKDHTCRYVINPLLKDYICKNLSEDRKNILHNILGEYFERKFEFPGEIFYHSVNRGDYEKAGKIFPIIMKQLFPMGYYGELIEKIELLEHYISLSEDIKIMKARLLHTQGRWNESMAILEQIKDNTANEHLLLEVHALLAILYMNMCNIPRAIDFYEYVLKKSREAGNMGKIVKVMNHLTCIYLQTGEIEKASHIIQESFDIAVKENNQIGLAESLRVKARILSAKKRYGEALEHFEKCLAIAENIGSLWLIPRIFIDKSETLYNLRRYDEAIECLEESLALGNETGDDPVISSSYMYFGIVFYEKGDMEKSLQFFNMCLEKALSSGNKVSVNLCKFNMALIYERQKDLERAIDLYSSVMENARDLSYKKLEIISHIKILENRLRINKTPPSFDELLEVKRNIPESYLNEKIEINFILFELYLMKNKDKEKEIILSELLELAEKDNCPYSLARVFYVIARTSKKSLNEREAFLLKSQENFEKVRPVQKMELENFFKAIDEKTEKKFLIKFRDRELKGGISQVEELRNKKEEFEFFLDMPGKIAFEKERGEINIFKKTKLLFLLLLLIRNKDKGFTSEDIYGEIYGGEYETDISGTEVRKYISRIRDMIEPDRKNFRYILHNEGFFGEKGKYSFNNKTNFCYIERLD